MQQANRKRLEDAKHYALADKSDPFALRRIMMHMSSGVCGFGTNGADAFYAADPYQEERFLDRSDGSKEAYHVTVYRNMVRP